MSFKAARDFEAPGSGGGDNVCDVTVKVSDGRGGSVVKALWIKVQDFDEVGLDRVVVEAEAMHDLGFDRVHGSQASGGALEKLRGHDGKLWTDFSGESGTYDLSIFAQDENDGASKLMVYVDGRLVDTIVLDR